MTELKILADIISTGIDKIQAACDAKNAVFPPLDEPFAPESDAIRMEVYADVVPVIAAAHQLIAALQMPTIYAMSGVLSMSISSAVSVILAANVPEIVREGGPQGLHVNDISAKCSIPAHKLESLLRLLATFHIFKEVSPGVFKHNRISSCYDTGKSLESILAEPVNKYDNGFAIAALAGHSADETLKSSGYMKECLTDPQTASSEEPNEAPFNRAFRTNVMLWEWLEQPENVLRRKRFGVAMKGSLDIQNPRAILDFPLWEQIREGGIVVDVGGGIGSTTMTISDVHKHLRYIVQDREAVVKDGIEHWRSQRPEALKSGLVKLQAHDFFQKQPIENASVYLLRVVLHDWPDAYAAKILKQIREAASSDSKLVLQECVVQYACPSTSEHADIPGAVVTPAPAPLLANFGIAKNISDYYADFIMMSFFNAHERTVGQWVKLLAGTGWKLERIYPTHPIGFSKLVASPV